MRVKIEEIKIAAELLFRHLEEDGIQSVEIPYDFYWSISKESLYNPYSAPDDLTLGQLSDDLNEIRRIASRDTDAIAFGLVWLSSIIRAVGEQVVA